MGGSTKQPTLKCNGTKMDKFADKTEMYVGALTADEIVYAGADANLNENVAYYLLNDYQNEKGLWWWGLSPYYFDRYYDSAFFVTHAGILGYLSVDRGDPSFRPAVSLASSVSITDGVGTIDDPYIIKSN